ncbi:MAG: hypothetical protein DSM106950_09740 [Stigonema ocellatum SAG 48.90 = DSM 106950]|nr:hypothetical protein [Stigonema ocellatum SAG 48.90 = DSM 106950]
MQYESLEPDFIRLNITDPQGVSGDYFEQISPSYVMTGMKIRKGDIIDALTPEVKSSHIGETYER